MHIRRNEYSDRRIPSESVRLRRIGSFACLSGVHREVLEEAMESKKIDMLCEMLKKWNDIEPMFEDLEKNGFGMILGEYGNVLDHYRSERSLIGNIMETIVE